MQFKRNTKIGSVTKYPKKENNQCWYKTIGMGFKFSPKMVKNFYDDKKCPFKGNVSIRGRILKGMVISTKMKNSIIVRKDYLYYRSKYKRFERRHTNIPCHCSPYFKIKEGDLVTIGQCRPLSKTIRFNVLRIDSQKN
ncbi:40S ribosomal protein S11 (nucleomorph) [Cryptomonas paramecium]|uniref:Small ribosomal subunit protein uS17 n=1 Tax=Cryptomonas paramaecium TaxID=2898 RepID=F2HHY7_9CRYP|nr:40S ribosomal protein S11 [Cryptomonas paramecium]AEA38933.1 40S ribosomal protein S11 [Cryptomonas paramecium]|mmetsp:Transcript_59201/g.157214  ORF Transcript_59201/g.157214 Transcript_59201/m.157214 type:complete len:138 (+) Transcript_59201:1157-1570(+)